MNQIDMKKLGFTEDFAAVAACYEEFYVGRILAQEKDYYQVGTAKGQVLAEVSGKFRFAAATSAAFPAVGDFVMLDRQSNESGNAIIHQVLPRKSAFIRKAAGTANEDQIVASNIDTVFICMSLNHDFNLRRLERYLAIGWDSGAAPVVVLTKADLCSWVEQLLVEVEGVAVGATVLVTTALCEDGYRQLGQLIKPGQTVAFIGSSGVGKSTLINCLLGEQQLATSGLREDDKGRHTTTRRQLIPLKSGGMVIDTPGMRELGLERANLSKTFAEIDELAIGCKFHDCTHTSEPGCLVQKAAAEGRLSAERLTSYQKLRKEAQYEGLNSRQIETWKLNEMFRSVGGMKNARKFCKAKNKKR